MRGPRHARLELQAGQKLSLRLQLSRPHHRLLESQASNPAGFSHQVHLGRGLDHPQLVETLPELSDHYKTRTRGWPSLSPGRLQGVDTSGVADDVH